MQISIKENTLQKQVRSEKYNYNFNKRTGFFARWGIEPNDDPAYAPGPEILDIEISSGKCSGDCPFCYKENNSNKSAQNMTFEQFKNIFDKMPKTLTQIAFGICDVDTNPDMFRMFEYARDNGVIPNYTCNGHKMTPEIARKTVELCGAVAVSVGDGYEYEEVEEVIHGGYDKDSSYNTIDMLTKAGMNQVNIHFMLSEQTYEKAFDLIRDVNNDERLRGLNAIVFLAYKPKGKNKDIFTTITDTKKYKKLIEFCESHNVNYGMDSCSAAMYVSTIQYKDNRVQLSQFVESCESSLFSGYINSQGKYFHCSFSEGEGAWKNGIDVLAANSFEEVWNHPLTVKFRRASIKTAQQNPHKDCGDCRLCLMFNEVNPW